MSKIIRNIRTCAKCRPCQLAIFAALAGIYVSLFSIAPARADALADLQKRANDGDPKATCELGLDYEHGKLVAQDYGQAMNWYRKAADAGDQDAKAWLAKHS